MAQVKHHKFVAALPAQLEANAIYYVRAGAGFDLYVTNSSGTVVAYPINAPAGGGGGAGTVAMMESFTAEAGASYWLGSSLTVTLPSTTTPPPKGTLVRLTKALTAKPVIQAGAGSAVIATSKGNDTSVTFDINAEIIFIFNGTNWEV